MNLAKITLIGNLGGDPETRFTPNGVLVANFSIAVNSRRGEQETTNWFRCACFGKLAETVTQLSEKGYLVKGKQVYVEGTFEAREWTAQDGGSRTSLDVTVRELVMLGQRGDTAESESTDNDGSEMDAVTF